MNYQKSIDSIISHPYLAKGYQKLGKQEIKIFLQFFTIEYLGKGEAMEKCNRMFMDITKKPKNWTTIMELVSSVISHHYSH